jgi:hypothetical protein
VIHAVTATFSPRACRPFRADGCGGHRFLRRCRRLSPVAALRQENNATRKCEGRTHPSGSPRPPSAPKGQQAIGRGKRSDALDATPTPKSPVGATGHDRDLCHTTASPRRPSYETCGSHQIKAPLSSFIRACRSRDQPELKGRRVIHAVTATFSPRACRPFRADGCGGHRFLRRCRRLSPVAALRQENNATPKCEGRTHPSGSPRPPSAPKGQQAIGRGKRSDALDATPTPKSPVGATGHDRDLCHTTASPRRPSYETCGSHQIKAPLSSFIRAFRSRDQPELKGRRVIHAVTATFSPRACRPSYETCGSHQIKVPPIKFHPGI